MGRPRKDYNISIGKDLKAIGATSARQNGNQIELMLDPSKLPAAKRKNLAGGLLSSHSSMSNTMLNDPMDESFFDGPFSAGSVLETHQKIRLANRYFRSEPLVGKIIEFMAVLAATGFKNEHQNNKIKSFYDNWCDKVNMSIVRNWLFLEYFRSGNVVTYRELLPYNRTGLVNPAYDMNSAGVLVPTEANKKSNLIKRVMIPGAYTVLNPLHVFVKANNAFMDTLYFDLQKVMSTQVDTSDEMDNITLSINRLPGNLKMKHQGSDKIPLNKKNVKRILRMRQPYEPYGSVLMERAFAPIHEKNKMRMMDMTMVNSLVNQIIKVTIGNDEYPATAKQLQRLAKAFQNTGKSQTIFWNHTLNIEVIRPDTKVLNAEKYQRVNEDIRSAFGISDALLGQGAARVSPVTAQISLKIFLTNITSAREDIVRWMRAEYEDIAEVMGFDSIAIPGFEDLSLVDEAAEKQIVLGLVDRGIISYETAQQSLGYDSQTEIQRKKIEKPLLEEGILGPSMSGSPYQQSANSDKEPVSTQEQSGKGDEVEEIEKGKIIGNKVKIKVNPSTTGGRPLTPSGNYPQNRKPTTGR